MSRKTRKPAQTTNRAAAAPLSNPPDNSPKPLTLRAALWTYCAALVCTALWIINLQNFIQPLAALRFVAALIFCLGFTAAALLITQTSAEPIFGAAPRPLHLLIGLVIGVLLWLPVTWIMAATNYVLDSTLGILPAPSSVVEGAGPTAAILQLGVLVPLFQGVLFWGLIQRAAGGLGRLSGALLTAALFGLFGLVATELGYAALPGTLLVGLAAAFAVYFTGSAWPGILVTIGYALPRPALEGTLLESQIFTFLGFDPEALFGGRWLLVTVIGIFAAYMLLQALRAQAAPAAESVDRPPAPRRWWQVPLVASLIVCLLIGYAEVALRSTNQLRQNNGGGGSGATIAPQINTPTPP